MPVWILRCSPPHLPPYLFRLASSFHSPFHFLARGARTGVFLFSIGDYQWTCWLQSDADWRPPIGGFSQVLSRYVYVLQGVPVILELPLESILRSCTHTTHTSTLFFFTFSTIHLLNWKLFNQAFIFDLGNIVQLYCASNRFASQFATYGFLIKTEVH